MAALAQSLRARFDARITRWIERHNPVSSKQVTLHQRRVYILPTRFGYLYGAMMVLLFLAAVNYQNSMAFVLTFTLTALGIISLWQTHRNLLGLGIDLQPPAPVFSGDAVEFHFRLDNQQRQTRYAIGIQYAQFPPAYAGIPSEDEAELILRVPSQRRGHFLTGPFTIFTRYPTGLFHAWGHLRFEVPVIVFPHPDYSVSLMQSARVDDDGKIVTNTVEGDDFAGLRDHREGESLRHVSWKAYAQGRGLLTKTFQGHSRPGLWIDFNEMPGTHTEDKLAQMAALVLLAENENRAYGLILPNETLPQLGGAAHRQACLSLLSLYAQADRYSVFAKDD